MSDYAHKPKGGLKFKGEGEKKKKKKSSTSTDRAKVDAEISQKDKEVETKAQAGSSSAAASGSGEHGGRRLTESERRFEEVQKKRREERARKNAHLSHKERVSEFNSKLDRLTEHHDMPKIGPG